jgi:hypothetical protein
MSQAGPRADQSDTSYVPGVEVPLDSGTTFADQSYLTYLVPASTNLDLENLFGDIDAGKPILESIKTRESLFFGIYS